MLEKTIAWKTYTMRRLNGSGDPINTDAQFRQVTHDHADWVTRLHASPPDFTNRSLAPYMAYMPERNRLVILFARYVPGHAMLTFSDDLGDTWSLPVYLHTDAQGNHTNTAVSLTYLGGGKLLAAETNPKRWWLSSDYGETWQPLPPSGEPWESWDPLLVNRDAETGEVSRLVWTGWRPTGLVPWGSDEGTYSQGSVRFSFDQGRTWPQESVVPQWFGVNETILTRASNGDLIGACRTDSPKWLATTGNDSYGGLGVSISQDNGRTWSDVNRLYYWGRHHPCMVVMPDGDIVMTYIVRRGYPDTPDGRSPRFGIEAVVSHDNGQTWDLDHRYILIVWNGEISSSDPNCCLADTQNTSTVFLPDGFMLTTFVFKGRNVGLVKWRLGDKVTDTTDSIRSSPYDSDLRNKFDPGNGRHTPPVPAGRNIATAAEGTVVSSSHIRDAKAEFLRYDPYLFSHWVNFDTIPAWVQVEWPSRKEIDAICIYPGDPSAALSPRTECVPLDYCLQYWKDDEWIDIIPPVNGAMRYEEFRKIAQPGDEFKYVHKFRPVSTKAVRIYLTKSSDSGRRENSDEVVAAGKRLTTLRRIEVFESE